MPDTKITALTAIGANPIIPATFPIPMVDLTDTSMAASGTTKKVTVNQILGAGGTATLASATITGDLTVDTNVLKVNTTTNRVGINTTTPTQNLQITGSGDPLTVDGCSAIKLTNTVSGRAAIVGIDDSQNFVIWNVGTEVSETIKFLTGGGSGKEQYRITHGGVFNWYDGAGGTRMTLNSTGLGVGGSPATGVKLHVGGGNAHIRNAAGGQTKLIFGPSVNSVEMGGIIYDDTDGTVTFGTIQNYATRFITNNTERGRFDSSGNLLVGTTTSPSGAKVGAITKLSGVSAEGTASINVSTTPVALSRVTGTSGLFFVMGYNASGGAQGWYLVASTGSGTPTVISSGGTPGLTLTFTMSGGQLNAQTASGTFVANAFSITA